MPGYWSKTNVTGADWWTQFVNNKTVPVRVTNEYLKINMKKTTFFFAEPNSENLERERERETSKLRE